MYYLKCAAWNIHGLFQRLGSYRSCKLDDDYFVHELSKYDIFGLIETHASSEDAIYLEGYHSQSKFRVRPDKGKRNSGGVSVFVRENLTSGVEWLQHVCKEYL